VKGNENLFSYMQYLYLMNYRQYYLLYNTINIIYHFYQQAKNSLFEVFQSHLYSFQIALKNRKRIKQLSRFKFHDVQIL